MLQGCASTMYFAIYGFLRQAGSNSMPRTATGKNLFWASSGCILRLRMSRELGPALGIFARERFPLRVSLRLQSANGACSWIQESRRDAHFLTHGCKGCGQPLDGFVHQFLFACSQQSEIDIESSLQCAIPFS